MGVEEGTDSGCYRAYDAPDLLLGVNKTANMVVYFFLTH